MFGQYAHGWCTLHVYKVVIIASWLVSIMVSISHYPQQPWFAATQVQICHDSTVGTLGQVSLEFSVPGNDESTFHSPQADNLAKIIRQMRGKDK